MQHNLHNGPIFGISHWSHQCRSRSLPIDDHPPADTFKQLRGWVTIEQSLILLLDLVSWMHDPVCDFAVIRQKQEPLRLTVESTDWNHSLVDRDEVHDRVPSAFIRCRGDVSRGLIEQNVAQAGTGNQLPIDLDLLPAGIHLRSELRNDLTVNPNAARNDQIFRFPARGDTARRQDPL